ncbi:DUF349 domain-containing protein [Puteibacter caeruleilacunae]|nr:DUF349 domain-containing protein [Puteibacter caeruleilacunae]
MEPKDLKNSEFEELKSTEHASEAGTENADLNTNENVETQEEVVGELVSEEGKEVVSEETKQEVAEEVESSAEPDTVVKEGEEQPEVEVKAEKEEEVEQKVETVVPDAINYSELSEVELINTLRNLLDTTSVHDIKDEVEKIKNEFYKKHWAQIAKLKAAFVEAGGEEKDFKPEQDPYEKDLRDLMKRYRDLKSEFNKSVEEEKEDNLKEKYRVIEEIKELVNRKESINKTFHEFRELQTRWREIGLVPQAKLKDLWETYHHHVENFYDYIKINRELRDLDLKKNLQLKITLCERAEELLMESSVVKAFGILQKYHEQWREIGPVPREKKEELWERFKAATSQINKRHQQYFEDRKKEQKKNLEAKTVLCEKADEIAALELKSFKEWDEKSKELIELQKVWRTIGFAPKKDNNSIYERFRTACDQFFDKKRDFYAKSKADQSNNLQLKTDLCVQAEALKDSTDWKKTTDEYIKIQRRWKEIGPVPRKHSDSIWKRFRAACDFFFDRKSEHFKGVDNSQVDNLKAKEALVEEILKFELTGNEQEDLDTLKGFQRKWTEIGHVPFENKDEILRKYRSAIDSKFDNLRVDEKNRNLLKFRSKMENFTGSVRGVNKMRFEREKHVNKLKQLENELVLLDNNIGFFSNSKNAEALIADVRVKIERVKEQIKLLKNKIRIIDEIDDED